MKEKNLQTSKNHNNNYLNFIKNNNKIYQRQIIQIKMKCL